MRAEKMAMNITGENSISTKAEQTQEALSCLLCTWVITDLPQPLKHVHVEVIKFCSVYSETLRLSDEALGEEVACL